MRMWALTLALVASMAAPFPWELQALAVAPADMARAKAGETIVSDVPVSEGGSLRAVFFVAGPLAVAREVLWDQERFVEFVPDVKAVKVLERHPNRQIVEITGGRGPVSVSYVADRTLEARRIAWKSVRGDVKRNDGSWTLEPAPGGTLVTYQVHVVPKGPVPGYVVGYLQKQALTGLIKAIRTRIEAKSAGR
ncbi:MAG: type II toxin-antitoxin system RatA family toxin [Candidatus Sericytochromatia bacterium]